MYALDILRAFSRHVRRGNGRVCMPAHLPGEGTVARKSPVSRDEHSRKRQSERLGKPEAFPRLTFARLSGFIRASFALEARKFLHCWDAARFEGML